MIQDRQTRELQKIYESMEATLDAPIEVNEPEVDSDDVGWSIDELEDPLKTRAETVLTNITNKDSTISDLSKQIAETTDFYYAVAEQLILTIEQGLTPATEGGYQNMLDELADPDPRGAGILLTDFEFQNMGDSIGLKNIWSGYTLQLPKSLIGDELVLDLLLKTIAEIYRQFPVGESNKVNFSIALKKYIQNQMREDPEEMAGSKRKVLSILNNMFSKPRIELENRII